MAFQLPHADVP